MISLSSDECLCQPKGETVQLRVRLKKGRGTTLWQMWIIRFFLFSVCILCLGGTISTCPVDLVSIFLLLLLLQLFLPISWVELECSLHFPVPIFLSSRVDQFIVLLNHLFPFTSLLNISFFSISHSKQFVKVRLTLSLFQALHRCFNVVFCAVTGYVLADIFIHHYVRSWRGVKNWLEQMAEGLQL